MNTHNRPADIAATLVLLIVDGALFGATIVLLGLFVMITDPWGDVKWGDPAWIDRDEVGDLGWRRGLACRRCRRRISPGAAQVAIFVPVIGCLAQVALGIGAAESLAGPVH
jgi:hypothetical protein